jgi:FHS family L-fucose permease-like MFS transporter
MMILASSFFMSLMFATIFAMGIKDLGPNPKLGGSLLVMSVAGGAVFPPLLGWVAKRSGSYALSYTVPLGAYIVVALYGYYGRRMKVSDQQRCAVTVSARG